jgi:hypothetical protein
VTVYSIQAFTKTINTAEFRCGQPPLDTCIDVEGLRWGAAFSHWSLKSRSVRTCGLDLLQLVLKMLLQCQSHKN